MCHVGRGMRAPPFMLPHNWPGTFPSPVAAQVCRITELSTSKTGKHGHAKVKIVAKDVVTGKPTNELVQSHGNVQVPAKAWLNSNKKLLQRL